MSEGEDRPTLNYRTPDPLPGKRLFWPVYIAACFAGFLLTDQVISASRGGRPNDSGVAILAAFGIFLVSPLVMIFKAAFPRARLFAWWFAIIVGLLAAPTGLFVYTMFLHD